MAITVKIDGDAEAAVRELAADKEISFNAAATKLVDTGASRKRALAAYAESKAPKAKAKKTTSKAK